MARRKSNRLSAKEVGNAKVPGDYPDGLGLYLQVADGGSKSWIFRYKINGRPRWMGLGALHAFTLAQARERATAQRQLLADGIDPIEHRAAARAEQIAERAKERTFGQCAEAYIRAHRKSWKNEKHADQWRYTLETFAKPFWKAPVRTIDTGMVVAALEPIWAEKHETAQRTRARIEAVLGFATVRGYRHGDNPARWKGHLKTVLANLKKGDVRHHAALPYAELPRFIQELRQQEGAAARAMEFLILTAARTGEVRLAKPDEINGTTWIVPAPRMKSSREHRVPLSARALEIARGQPDGAYLFAGGKPDKPMSEMALLMLLRRMGREGLTVHGFRSTFRDWTAEQTSYPRDVCEMALAHTLGDKTEAAYKRTDLFEKRKRLMNAWAKFCDMPMTTATVTALRHKG